MKEEHHQLSVLERVGFGDASVGRLLMIFKPADNSKPSAMAFGPVERLSGRGSVIFLFAWALAACAGPTLLLAASPPAAPAKDGPVTSAAQPGAMGDVEHALDREDPAAAVKLAGPLAESGNADAQFVLGFLSDLGAGTRLDHAVANRWLTSAAGQGHPLARAYLSWKFATGFGVAKADAAEAAKWGEKSAAGPVIAEGLARWLAFRNGAFVPKFSRAYRWMSEQAESGNAMAQGNLAQVYLEKEWVSPDAGQHVYWLRQAADRKDAPSLERLAYYYELGLLGAKDPAKALALRRTAAETGSASAQLALGRHYEDDESGADSAGEAAKWYRLAAAQENMEALQHLVTLLREGGPGLPQDFGEAFRLAQHGAEKGDGESIKDLADLYNRGEGVAVDYAKSAKLYHEAAAKGIVHAMTMIAWMNENNEVDPPDFGEALRWGQLAAEKGSPVGMRLVGALYEEGRGVEKDPAKAFEWYERAARQSDGWSQNHLGWMLRQGIGVARDDEEAVNWFRLAVKNDEITGESNLGYHYLNGLGVERNPREAFVHLAAALREIDDSWTIASMMQLLFGGSAEDRKRFEDLLQTCVEDPKLPAAKGALPEVCLQALSEGRGDHHAEVAGLLRRLAEAHRARSASLLAWHSFLGWDMPYDLPKAREWARESATLDPKQSAYLLACIDSVSADVPADREAARQALHKLADEGYPLAIHELTHRLVFGEGEPADPAAAIRYYNLRAGLPSGQKVSSIEELHQRFGLHPPKTPPTDAEMVKVFAALAETPGDSMPRAIYQTTPVYPYDLKVSGLSGKAEVDFVIDTEGRVKDLRVVNCSHPFFGLAAGNAVPQWRFAPGKKAGHLVNTRVVQSLLFTLEDEPAKPPASPAPNPNVPPSTP